jgi:hypothetical protein
MDETSKSTENLAIVLQIVGVQSTTLGELQGGASRRLFMLLPSANLYSHLLRGLPESELLVQRIQNLEMFMRPFAPCLEGSPAGPHRYFWALVGLLRQPSALQIGTAWVGANGIPWRVYLVTTAPAESFFPQFLVRESLLW